MSVRRTALALIAVAAGFVLGMPQHAAAQSCSATIGDVTFTGIDLLPGQAADATATVHIQCSNILLPGVSICPYIGFGGGGADATSRLAPGPSGNLRYELYSDSNHTQIWGDPDLGYGSAPVVQFAGALTGRSDSTDLTLYARILPGQAPLAAGTYTSIFSTAETRFIYGLVFPLGILGCDGVVTLLNQTIHPTFTMSATIEKNCELTTEDLDFGTHGVLAGAVTATGELSVRCTPDAGYSVGLGNGNTGSGPTAREMKLGANTITYGLYKDGGYAEPWGDSGGALATGTGNGNQQELTIYGRVPPQPTPTPGTYSDTIIVTVTY